MESIKSNNCTGTDVTGNNLDLLCSEINATGDSVDALPKILSKICSGPKEESKIYVHQCKDDSYYNMNHPKRGLAVIFNHEDFDPDTGHDKREGTKADCESLQKTLGDMSFTVIVHNDLLLKELESELDKLAASDYEDCDCLLLIILSHGEDQGRIFARNRTYTTAKLFDRFTADKCPSLAGKPKLFFIQSCRGKELCAGVDVDYDQLDSGVSAYRMPLHADFLFAYSTIPGHYSWRNTGIGSWFIQALCQEQNDHWKELDLLTILTFVNRRVAFDFESYVPRKKYMCGYKQTSTFTSQLTRILTFFPKTRKAPENGTPV